MKGNSTIIMYVKGYDKIRALSETKSLCGDEAKSCSKSTFISTKAILKDLAIFFDTKDRKTDI